MTQLARREDGTFLPIEQPIALPEIIERYLKGESLQVIAKECNVATRTIYRWMLSGLGDKNYYDTVTECLTSRVADADIDLATATDPCQIARARETARFARMDLERRRPHLYGQKQEVTHHNKSPSLSITIVQAGDAKPVIDAVHTAVIEAEGDMQSS